MTNPNAKSQIWIENGSSVHSEDGLTKREHFAALAMKGYCSHPEIGLEDFDFIADHAVQQADALITALNNNHEPAQ